MRLRSRLGILVLAGLFVAEVVTASADLVICTGPGRALGAADCHSIGERLEAAAAKGAAVLGLWGASKGGGEHHP
jgi:hypothetical protein